MDRGNGGKELSSKAEMPKPLQHGKKKRVYMIINAWQQIEDERKNIMGFETSERARHRTIKDIRIKWSKKSENSTIIHNSPAHKMN